jgi:hypothetical protein
MVHVNIEQRGSGGVDRQPQYRTGMGESKSRRFAMRKALHQKIPVIVASISCTDHCVGSNQSDARTNPQLPRNDGIIEW